jgi:hypothetical protein
MYICTGSYDRSTARTYFQQLPNSQENAQFLYQLPLSSFYLKLQDGGRLKKVSKKLKGMSGSQTCTGIRILLSEC